MVCIYCTVPCYIGNIISWIVIFCDMSTLTKSSYKSSPQSQLTPQCQWKIDSRHQPRWGQSDCQLHVVTGTPNAQFCSSIRSTLDEGLHPTASFQLHCICLTSCKRSTEPTGSSIVKKLASELAVVGPRMSSRIWQAGNSVSLHSAQKEMQSFRNIFGQGKRTNHSHHHPWSVPAHVYTSYFPEEQFWNFGTSCLIFFHIFLQASPPISRQTALPLVPKSPPAQLHRSVHVAAAERRAQRWLPGPRCPKRSA